MSNNKNWDLFLIRAREVGKAVGETASNVVDESKKRLDEVKLRRDLADCYEVLGRLYYRGKKSNDFNGEKICEIIASIEKLEGRLARMKSERERAKRTAEPADIRCPFCGGPNRGNARYCSFCGKEMRD